MNDKYESGTGREYLWFTLALIVVLLGSTLPASKREFAAESPQPQAIERTTPPSTLSDAPVVPAD